MAIDRIHEDIVIRRGTNNLLVGGDLPTSTLNLQHLVLMATATATTTTTTAAAAAAAGKGRIEEKNRQSKS